MVSVILCKEEGKTNITLLSVGDNADLMRLIPAYRGLAVTGEVKLVEVSEVPAGFEADQMLINKLFAKYF